MSTIIEFILENDIVIMTALLILIVVLTVIVLILDFINKRKNAKDANIIFKDNNSNVIDAFKEEFHEENPLDYTTDFGQLQGSLNVDNQEIKYVEEDEELEKTKAQLELKNLKEELLKAEVKAKEESQKQEELPKKEEVVPVTNNADPVDAFESQQEENAIISLEQFKLVSNEMYDQNEVTQYKDEGNEPISIKELEELYNTKELKQLPKDEEIIDVSNIDKVEPVIEEPKKFKTSPIISPVYGTVDQDLPSKMALENTANLDKLNEEIRKTNEFLTMLKELRKNLE